MNRSLAFSWRLFLAFAAVDPVRQSLRRHQLLYRGIVVGGVMLFAARMSVVADAWTNHRRDVAEHLEGTAALLRGFLA